MIRGATALALALALSLGARDARPEPASPGAAESERLAALVALYPDDPDLRLALARALEREGALDAAERELTTVAGSRGDGRPELLSELGRVRFRRGQHGPALESLERALELGARDAETHLYRGLALRALGRLGDSDVALARAETLSGPLQPEILLVRALNRYARGERGEGEQLLRRVIELAPGSPSAREAQALLGGSRAEIREPRRLELSAEAGVEFDSNVTLEGSGLPGSTDRRDVRLVYGAAIAARVLERERTSLSLGYRYRESAHEDQKAFDLRSHLLFASGAWDVARGTRLRLDALAQDAHLDDDRYLRSWTLRPNLFRQIGPRAGITRAYLEIERADYHEPPLLPPFERGGHTSAVALEHYLPIPRLDGGVFMLGGRLERVDTDASNIAGFAGDFDLRGREATARARFPLGHKIEGELSGSLGSARYRHRNLIDLLVPDGSVDRRRDRVLTLGAALTRPLWRRLSVELRWSLQRQSSNVDPYEYDRQIVALLFKATTF